MKKIILATDFSKGASKAEELAISIAKTHISEIIVLYCSSPTYIDPNVPSGMVANLEVERENKFNEKLTAKARSIQEQGVRTSYKFCTGSVAEGIELLKEEENADFVILGKTGSTGLLEKLIGSTAEYVFNNIKIPMLVVPELWQSTKIDRIQYATELEYDEKDILADVFDIAYKLKAEVNLVNVQSDTQFDLNDNGKLIADMKKAFPNKDFEIKSVRSNRVEDTILELSEAKENTAVVVASHHRGFLDGILKPSMSKRVIAKTKVPTFVYHFE